MSLQSTQNRSNRGKTHQIMHAQLCREEHITMSPLNFLSDIITNEQVLILASILACYCLQSSGHIMLTCCWIILCPMAAQSLVSFTISNERFFFWKEKPLNKPSSTEKQARDCMERVHHVPKAAATSCCIIR